MRKLKNPFASKEGYNCFGCSRDNHHGLQMEFYEDGDYLVSEWEPKSFLQGYGNVLHGGIQTTLMDEIASWVVYVKAKTGGVTANLEVKFKKAVYVDKGPLTIRAKLNTLEKRFAYIYAELLDNEGNVCAEANLRYFVFPEKVAREKLFYPGSEAFYE
jgi:uncharacterized protein (TIGR00369 family)